MAVEDTNGGVVAGKALRTNGEAAWKKFTDLLAPFAPKEVVDENGQTFYALNGMTLSLLAGSAIGGVCFHPEFPPFFTTLLLGSVGGIFITLFVQTFSATIVDSVMRVRRISDRPRVR